MRLSNELGTREVAHALNVKYRTVEIHLNYGIEKLNINTEFQRRCGQREIHSPSGFHRCGLRNPLFSQEVCRSITHARMPNAPRLASATPEIEQRCSSAYFVFCHFPQSVAANWPMARLCNKAVRIKFTLRERPTRSRFTSPWKRCQSGRRTNAEGESEMALVDNNMACRSRQVFPRN